MAQIKDVPRHKRRELQEALTANQYLMTQWAVLSACIFTLPALYNFRECLLVTEVSALFVPVLRVRDSSCCGVCKQEDGSRLIKLYWKMKFYN